jgi:arginase
MNTRGSVAKPVEILAVPYDSGHRGVRMGRGPEHLLRGGIEGKLVDGRRQVRARIVEARSPFRAEIATAFELFRRVSERVGAAVEAGSFPLVLSGNCNNTVGVVAGLAGSSPDEVGIVWFDGHADFNTPETTTTGFLDGMGLAITVGRGWANMMRDVPYFRPVRVEDVVLLGDRGASPIEKELLRTLGVTVVEEEGVARKTGEQQTLHAALDALRGRVRRVHVHLDLDVLDPEKVGPANEFAPEGGVTVEEVEECILAIRERFEVASATVASYDPDHDREDRVLRAAVGFARSLTS